MAILAVIYILVHANDRNCGISRCEACGSARSHQRGRHSSRRLVKQGDSDGQLLSPSTSGEGSKAQPTSPNRVPNHPSSVQSGDVPIRRRSRENGSASDESGSKDGRKVQQAEAKAAVVINGKNHENGSKETDPSSSCPTACPLKPPRTPPGRTSDVDDGRSAGGGPTRGGDHLK